jgi:PAT family beta-lactamase induction signal transducer AmpG
VGAKSIGPIKSYFSWEYTILAFAGMIALAWILIQFLNINKQVQRVVDLENKDDKSGLLYAS